MKHILFVLLCLVVVSCQQKDVKLAFNGIIIGESVDSALIHAKESKNLAVLGKRTSVMAIQKDEEEMFHKLELSQQFNPYPGYQDTCQKFDSPDSKFKAFDKGKLVADLYCSLDLGFDFHFPMHTRVYAKNNKIVRIISDTKANRQFLEGLLMSNYNDYFYFNGKSNYIKEIDCGSRNTLEVNFSGYIFKLPNNKRIVYIQNDDVENIFLYDDIVDKLIYEDATDYYEFLEENKKEVENYNAKVQKQEEQEEEKRQKELDSQI